MSIFLFSSTPSYSAASLLAYALNEYCEETTAIFKGKGTEGFDKYYEKASFGMSPDFPREAIDASQWIFCGGKAYHYFFSLYGKTANKEKKDKKIKVILTDSQFCRNYKKWSNVFVKKNVIVFAMPDIFPYCINFKPIPYYPPVDVSLDKIREKKDEGLTICHSPFAKINSNTKGSAEIIKIIKNIQKDLPNIHSNILTNSSREETLRAKARSHIFIDQLLDGNPNIPMAWGEKKYQGALGKSGCEAMFLDTFVVTGAPEPYLEERYFPTPPICWVNLSNCEDKLRYYIGNTTERHDYIAKQKEWANKYLTLRFVAKHVYER